ncbi:MAG: branched-chain amino acid ABC transporter permease, partial [Actinobacteria bacterium]|nr:branched-chain amino acid ABC transporter permease [Actinomycetota bacterium]
MKREEFARAFRVSLPICIGYVALGIPCGVLGAAAGMTLAQVCILSLLMYSGSGQYMIAGMYLGGVPISSLSASVSLVSSRQLLYGSALSPYFAGVKKRYLTLFAATVTDESFGVNLARFQMGPWSPGQAQAVNSFSHTSWVLSNLIGALLGSWLVFDTSIAAFAMTSIFLCLFMVQKFTANHVIAAVVAIAGVLACKLAGFSGLAIIVGALLGV